jgi:hypothetical protein
MSMTLPTPEEFKRKLQEKAKLDPVYRDKELSPEERIKRLEQENAALKAAGGQRVVQVNIPPPQGFAAKLAAKRDAAKVMDQPDQFGSVDGKLLLDSIIFQTEMGPAAKMGFVTPKQKE